MIAIHECNNYRRVEILGIPINHNYEYVFYDMMKTYIQCEHETNACFLL